MNLCDWWNRYFSHRGRALALYRRGMKRAKRQDYQGAIDDYTTTMGMPHVPPDIMAMVLYNRALAHVATGDDQQGAEDLEAVLAVKELVVNVKTMARQKLARMESRATQCTGQLSGGTPITRRESCSS